MILLLLSLMQYMLSIQPAWIETGDDLAKEFLNRIDEHSRNAITLPRRLV